MAVEQVADGVFKIPSILGVRRFAQWLVVGDEVMLVDTGIDGTIGEHVLPALAELGIAPERITQAVISHADVDHYGGDAEVRAHMPNARIRASAPDRRLLEEWDVIGRERYGWYRQHGLDYDPATFEWLRTAAGPDTPIDGEVVDGEVIDLGGVAVEIMALPGHSAGHVGVYEPASQTAIVMDAVLERGLYDVDGTLISPPPYVTVAGYRGSIARLRELDPERLGTSHYPATEGAAAVAAFLDASASFIDDLEACVLATLDETPRPLAEFWARADATIGPFSEMAVELARSVGAHLEDAEERGLAGRFEADGRVTWAAA